jgi:hypothetical protein
MGFTVVLSCKMFWLAKSLVQLSIILSYTLLTQAVCNNQLCSWVSWYQTLLTKLSENWPTHPVRVESTKLLVQTKLSSSHKIIGQYFSYFPHSTQNTKQKITVHLINSLKKYHQSEACLYWKQQDSFFRFLL